MEYLDLLVKLRDCTREAEKIKRTLMLSSNSRAETKEELTQKSAYMRAEGERSHLMKVARQTTRASSDPVLMQALFLRRVHNTPWEEIVPQLATDRSEMDLRVAAFEYVKSRFPKGSERYQTYINDKYAGTIEKCITDNFAWVPEELRTDLIQKVCAVYDKDFFRNGYVGIAITGYGHSDIFPKVKHLHVGGVINGKLRYKTVEEASISEDNTASMLPLAQTDVMQTFLFGINDSFINDIGNAIPQEINKCFERMDDALFADSKKDEVRQSIEQITPNVVTALAAKAHQEYMTPILQSVATLPIEELALLAESMINITSLRRKVVIDNNIGTVGGPIDVAIISKSDGFIWLKRKHYFDAKYNPQYLMTHYGRVSIPCDREG